MAGWFLRPARFVCVAFIILCGHQALAEEIPHPSSPEALKHLAAAKGHYDVREWAAAIEEYKAGARIEASPIFDYNLGQAYRQSHDYRAAIWHYERFLKSYSPSGPRTDSVRLLIKQMQAELEQQASKAPPTDAVAPPLTEASKPTLPLPNANVQPSAQSSELWYEDWFGWGLSGAGAASVGIGIAFIVGASGLRDDASREPDQKAARDVRTTADQHQLIGEIVAGAGAALLVTGIVKLAVGPSPTKSLATSVHIDLSGGLGVVVAGAF